MLKSDAIFVRGIPWEQFANISGVIQGPHRGSNKTNSLILVNKIKRHRILIGVNTIRRHSTHSSLWIRSEDKTAVSRIHYKNIYIVIIQRKLNDSIYTTEKIFESQIILPPETTWSYIIIYIWMITQHMVPNIGGTIRHKIKTRNHASHGTQCVREY